MTGHLFAQRDLHVVERARGDRRADNPREMTAGIMSIGSVPWRKLTYTSDFSVAGETGFAPIRQHARQPRRGRE